MIAMLLAGGQGSRLGVLTEEVAKPAVAFGGKFRIIDFPLSNCINSGIDTVGVLTQYQPLRLNSHIGIGIPWDLDRNNGGVMILPPYEKSENSEWYTGTANAIYQNINFIDSYNPDYVLILSGDHIYKMDYEEMLDHHKEKNADLTIAVMPVPMEEAKRFGIMVTDDDGRITDFQEKPEHPKSNLASMGIYIFTWRVLRDALITMKDQAECDFGKHIIPYCFDRGKNLTAYEFNGYWKDVGTLGSYWEANMGLVDIVPVFNLYEESWKIYTNQDTFAPQYIGDKAVVEKAIIGEGVMIEKAIIAEDCQIGDKAKIGIGEEKPSKLNKDVYSFGLVTIGENSVIPSKVTIGKNTAISGETTADDYPDGKLEAGEFIIKGGEA